MADLVMTDAQARLELADELAAFNLRTAAPGDPPLFTAEPVSPMTACHWRAGDIAAMLEKIGAKLRLEAGGQRRTLRLTNPGLAYGTTPLLWVSIQYILPGEIATAHRHTADALRFVMKGSGADTTVDGEQYLMNEGDLVLTPSWTWHDHEHLGSEPMVWIDVLDISLVRAMHATFFQAHASPRQPLASAPERSFRSYGSGIMRPVERPVDPRANPLLVYPAARAEAALRQAAALEPDPYDDVVLEYQNPLTGEPAMPTIGARLQMLRPGVHTQTRRHTGAVVYYVVRGEGATIIDGRRFDWSAGDFLALPPWAAHAHLNRSDMSEAVMFQVNDIPVLQKLGLYREQAVETQPAA